MYASADQIALPPGGQTASAYQLSSLIARGMDALVYRPANVQEMLDWAEFVSRNYGGMVSDIRKAVSYFMTDVRFEPIPGGELTGEDIEVYDGHVNSSEFHALVVEYATNLALFGTSLVLAHDKRKRMLVCRMCGATTALDELIAIQAVNVDTAKFEFKGRCFHTDCPSHGDADVFFDISDQYSHNEPPRFVFHDLRSVSLSFNPITGSYSVALYPNRMMTLRKGLANQQIEFLRETPEEILQALATNQEVILENGDAYHIDTIRPPSHRSTDWAGFGMPLFYSSFNNVMMLILVDAMNRKICEERIMPTEIISPQIANRGAMGTDMIADIVNPNDFEQRIMRIIGSSRSGLLSARRLFTFPYPVSYQVVGGDAKNLIPAEIMDFYKNQILDDMGIPPEIRNSGGQPGIKQSGGLVFFAASWAYMRHKMDMFVNWAANRVGRTLSLPPVHAFLEPPQMAGDPQRNQFLIDQYMAGNISASTVFRSMGFNMRDELKMSAQDNRWKEAFMQKIQREADEKGANQQAMAAVPAGAQVMQAQQGAGAPAGGGAPAVNTMMGPGAGRNGGDPAQAALAQAGFNPGEKNPQNLDQQADSLAQMIVQNPDRGAVQRIYDQIRGGNKMLHALVKQKVEQMRTQAASQGKAQLSAQQ